MPRLRHFPRLRLRVIGNGPGNRIWVWQKLNRPRLKTFFRRLVWLGPHHSCYIPTCAFLRSMGSGE